MEYVGERACKSIPESMRFSCSSLELGEKGMNALMDRFARSSKLFVRITAMNDLKQPFCELVHIVNRIVCDSE